jgi:hypothetical protein
LDKFIDIHTAIYAEEWLFVIGRACVDHKRAVDLFG